MSEQQERLLTSILTRAGEETITRQGVTATRMAFLADMLWDYVLEGVVRFPDGTTKATTPRDWIATAKWLYLQIAGPASARKPAMTVPTPTAMPNRHERRAAAARRS